MDGTFKAIPLHIQFRQLYIINVILFGRCYPLAYILMEKKDFNSYMTVFNELKKLIPAMNVVNCMSDYEQATRSAIKIQFPKSRISGCYFHYVQVRIYLLLASRALQTLEHIRKTAVDLTYIFSLVVA